MKQMAATRAQVKRVVDLKRQLSPAEKRASDLWYRGLLFSEVYQMRRARGGGLFCCVRGSFRDATTDELRTRLAVLKHHHRERSDAARALVREIAERGGESGRPAPRPFHPQPAA